MEIIIRMPDLAEVALAIHALATAVAYEKGTTEAIVNNISHQITPPQAQPVVNQPVINQPSVTPITAPQGMPGQYVPAPTTPAPVPVAGGAGQMAPVAPPVVPTTPQTYTLDQLSQAAARLMESTGPQVLFDLLATFGVQAMTQLHREQYGMFATKLRELGAKI